MTTPFVQYGYANGSANTVRPTALTYPDGRAIAFDYGSAGSMGDAASRVSSVVDDDNTHLADYAYLGERSFVVADSPEPEVKWMLPSLTGSNDPDTGDIYSGLDRFGRVKDNRWYDYGSSADVDRIQYGYDRAGNRIWRQNTVADALSKHFDELYGNDLIHRLKELSRGTLTAQKDAVTDGSFGECWSLDATGNWQKYLEDTDGSGSWDRDQSRTANVVNEITGISESTGPSWVTPAYSAAGNMTTVPQPADPTKSFTATYDAWNRLVKLVDDDTSDTVAEYAYDGANRRIIQKEYASGVLSTTRHLYYTEPSKWQIVEERIDSETDAERQFVWGQRYIDDLIVRDRDTDGNGTLDERRYCLQDANWNVTAIIDSAGDSQERYAYSAYGTPLFLNSAFVPQASSNFDWETLYAGYRWETMTELFHVRHRVLNSAMGVWCQRDPLGVLSEVNMYEYGSSRALIVTDPLGEISVVVAGFAGCGAGIVMGVIQSWGTSWRNILCQTISDCIIGAVAGVLMHANPRIAGCIAGAGVGAAQHGVKPICNEQCDNIPPAESLACDIAKALFKTILGCIIGGIRDPKLIEKVLIALDTALIALGLHRLCKAWL